MESVGMSSFWQGKKVFLTGHTGFKGSWLSFWLINLGAQVRGLSQPPTTDDALFEQLDLGSQLNHLLGDIRDRDLVKETLVDWQPDVVFHLAAQPLVRRSYIEPVETWNTNVIGTIHVLEALKHLVNPNKKE